jgi:hypothetical protein
MSLEYVGSVSLGQCVPTALTAWAQLTAALNLALPQLQAKLAGLLRVQAALSIRIPSLDALIKAVTNVVVQLQALLAAPLPSVGLSLEATAALVAQITVDLGNITAQLGFAAQLALVLGTPGIEAYIFDGTAGEFPAAVTPEFASGLRIGGGPNLPIYAVLLVATDGGAKAAMQKVLIS